MGGGAAVVQNTRQTANNMGLNGADSWQWTQQQADDFAKQTGMNPELLSLTGPRENGLLSQIFKIALQVGAPLLGAAIPGLAPFLGAALGGAGASAMSGDPLKQVLLSGVSAGAGNALGAGLTGAIGGQGFGAGLGRAITPNAGSILASGAGQIAGGSGVDSLIGNAGNDILGGAVGSGVTDVAPLIVTAGSGGGGGLGRAIGGAVGGVLSGGAGQDSVAGRPGGTGTDILSPTTGVTEVDPITVTAQPGNEITPPFPLVGGVSGEDVPGLASTELSALNNNAMVNNGGQPGLLTPEGLIGDTLGGIGADLGTGLLAQTLGLLPKPDLSGVPDAGWDEGAAVGPKGGDPFLQGEGPGLGSPANPPAQVVPAAGSAPPVAATPGGVGGNAGGAGGAAGAGAAPGVGTTDGAAAPSPIAAQSDIDLEGGLSPDIYPWRKVEF